METESLLSSVKWEIIKELSKEKQSPLQLAAKTSTTMANISQQLRILEAAGLVDKKKIPNRDKGKPRTLFFIKRPSAYLVLFSDRFADKRLFETSREDEAVIKTLMVRNPDARRLFQKAYWRLEKELPNIEVIAILEKEGKYELAIISRNSEEIEKIIAPLRRETINTGGVKITVSSSRKVLRQNREINVILIHNPEGYFEDKDNNRIEEVVK